jgi:protein TonB
MKKIVFLLMFLLVIFAHSNVLMAQERSIPEKESYYTVVDQMPEFVGGQDSMNRFIQSKIVYPKEALEKNKGGRVYIQFIIEKDGSQTQFEIVRGLGFGLDSAALNTVRQMPKWIPGKQAGKAVRVKCVIPVEFVMEKPKKRYVH